ncbi:MAG: ABC transporter substrate-binding protein [Methylobacteriaceae bacterium]|nr:ABC transporter substrate-binding protein [Methylobacteriaceae bacterium]MBV9244655.1 ABC transporter substrate-binding protein [Methylobacteriaceae bacterium]
MLEPGGARGASPSPGGCRGLTLRPDAAAAANAPGVTDTEIKIGQTVPYSGPASAYGAIGRAEIAYFRMINETGGVNGRKINLVSLDDGYSPPRTVEQIRRLVEEEQVAFIFNSLGTPSNSAIRDYLNENKVPQLFVATGASKWGDPQHYPWTMGLQPNYQTEAHIFAKQILATKPGAKIGVLYQNDDFGKDYLIGLKDGLGAKYSAMVVKEASYEVSEPTVDSQVVSLQASGADVFINVTTPKFAAQAIRKAYDLGWKPTQYLTQVANSIGAVMKPAGIEKGVGIIGTDYRKNPIDPQWQDDAGVKDWLAFMKKYMPDSDISDNNYLYGCIAAMTLVQVLKQCGNDLSRDNIMKEAANLKDFAPALLLPGIKLNTSPENFYPIRQMQLQRFNGKGWELFGDIISG